MNVAFRPLTRADFPLVRRWLETPHVSRWWHHETAGDALEADFGASIDGTDLAKLRVALAVTRDDAVPRPFGFLQSYRYADNPAYLAEVETIVATPAEAFSIDYFVGEASLLRQGWGAAMIRAALAALWREEPQAPAVIVPVSAANPASARVLERAGFTRIGAGSLEPDNPIDGPEHLVYRVDRPGL